MIGKAWGGVKAGHKSASNWAGRLGGTTTKGRETVGTGKSAMNRPITRQMTDAELDARGRRRVNTGLGVAGGLMGVRTIRGSESGSSSGANGLQAHSMGGTTMY